MKVSATVQEIRVLCPVCNEMTAVRLGGADGVLVYLCSSCDEEFEMALE